jgi:putative MATE family efflux protein
LKLDITYRSIWKVSLPIIIGLVAQNIMVAIDTAFLGRVGEVALGAGALGGLFYLAVVMLGIGFGTGMQILIGRRNGEKDYAQIGRITDHGIYFLAGLASFLFLVIFFLAPDILKFFIKSEEVYAGTLQFLKYRAWGIFFAFINIIFTSFYVGIVKTKLLTYSTIIAAITNAILDYFLIFGNGGFPQMGIAGAAMASSIAELVTALFFVIRTYYFEDIKRYNLFGFMPYDSVVMGRILNLSVPIMLQNFLSFAGWFVFFMIIEQLGEHALAVSNICRSIYMLMMIPLWGLCMSCNTLVSNLMGEGSTEKVIPLIKKIVTMSFLIQVVIVLFNVIAPRYIISIYTNNALLIEDSVNVLYVISLALIIFSVAIVLFMGVSGTGNTRVTFRFEIFTIALYQVVAFLLAIVFKVEVQYVWLVECMYFLIIGLLSYFYLRSGKWKLIKI